jgi:trans-aconitate methyltransferase
MDLKAQTVETYNKSAQALAKKFNDQGARVEDIEYVFSMCEQKNNPRVFEIGCGNGRDALEICKRTNAYQAIDISEELIRLAKEAVPYGNFKVADVEGYSFPSNIDIVFSFASLIHVPKENLKAIFSEIYDSLCEKGLLFVSLKHSPTYQQITKTDEFGTRTYWHYSPEDIAQTASQYKMIHTTIHELRGQVWMDILLQKCS